MEDGSPQRPAIPHAAGGEIIDPRRFRRTLWGALALPFAIGAVLTIVLAWQVLGAVGAALALLVNAALGITTRRRLAGLARTYDRALADLQLQAASLREREALFETFMDHHPGVAFMKDADGRLVYANAGMERVFRRPRQLLIGTSDEERLPVEVARQLRENDRAVLASGRAAQLLETVPNADGDPRRWLMFKFPFGDASGQELLGAVGVDVEERERALEEVQAVNAELERRVERRTAELTESNRELETFGYSVSHDLRAPLRAIDGFTRAVLEDHGEYLAPTARDHLHRVCAAAERMDRLIDDLLGLSRLSRAELERVPVDVTALAREVEVDLRLADPERRADVIVQDGLRAEADPRLLRVVLENLIGNAWKFTGTRDPARIEVGAVPPEDRRGSGPAFFVSDNGVGFDMAYASKLFSPFQRLHAARQFPGTGVGLASVKRVVRRHGGVVWAEAEPECGATFAFSLPTTPVSRNRAPRPAPLAAVG